MDMLHRALGALGIKQPEEEARPDFARLLKEAVGRIRVAELQIQESTSLEELDIGRSALVAAQAEIQQLIRMAKRDRGVALRPVAQNEEEYRRLMEYLHKKQGPERTQRRRTGTTRS